MGVLNPTIATVAGVDVVLAGSPSTTTQATGDSSGKVATTAFVQGALSKTGAAKFVYTANAGNTGTTETDLYSATLPAGALGTDKDQLFARYGFTCVSSITATRRIRLYFGGSVIFDSGALSISGTSAGDLDACIIRVSATVVRYSVRLHLTGASLGVYASVGELTGLTLSATNVLKVTGQAAGIGAATNDIVAACGEVRWESAP